MNIYEKISCIITNSDVSLAKSDAKDLLSWCNDNVEGDAGVKIDINNLLLSVVDDSIENLVEYTAITTVNHLNNLYDFDELLPFNMLKELYSLTTLTVSCKKYLHFGYTMEGALKYNGNNDVKYYIPRRSELSALFKNILKDKEEYNINYINYVYNTISYVEYVNNVVNILNNEKYSVMIDINKVKWETCGKLLHIIKVLNHRGYNFNLINDYNTITDIENTYNEIKDTFFHNAYSNIIIFEDGMVVKHRENIKDFELTPLIRDGYNHIDYKIDLLYQYTKSTCFKYSFGVTCDDITSNNSEEKTFIVDDVKRV